MFYESAGSKTKPQLEAKTKVDHTEMYSSKRKSIMSRSNQFSSREKSLHVNMK